MQQSIKTFAAVALLAAATQASPPANFRLHGKTWTDMGRIMHVTDTLQNNFSGNWQQSMGMQFQTRIAISPKLEGGLGFGLSQVYHSLGNREEEKFQLSKFVNFVSEARLTYSSDSSSNPTFRMDVGSFPFNYTPYVKNLGLYLFRGPVYPGLLVSGFKEYRTDSTRAGFLGLRLHNGLGNFQHDFLLSSERDLPPTFDLSAGYLARYKAWDVFEIGAGANWYHFWAENPDITDPKRTSVDGLFAHDDNLASSGAAFHPNEMHYYEILPSGDTVVFTHRGIKAGAFFNFDIKKALDLSAPFGERDLFIYGEMAVIGVKDYGTVYSKISERMPFMLGFHIPTLGLLDYLSFEVEHYKAKYRADYSKLGYDRSLYFKNISAPKLQTIRNPSALPISAKDLAGERYQVLPDGNFMEIATGDTIQIKGTALDPENLTADDWKWSLNAEKTLAKHVQISGQIANDHLVVRPSRPGLLNESGGMSEVFSSTKDWYFMLRIGYFF